MAIPLNAQDTPDDASAKESTNMIATTTTKTVLENRITGAYVLDPSASKVEFTVKNLFGLLTVRGRFTRFAGRLNVPLGGPRQATATGEAEAGSIDTGIRRRDGHLRAEHFLWVDEYPTISYRSGSVRANPLEPGQYEVEGALTVRGVTLPVTLEARLKYADWERIVVTATGETDRHQHGVTHARGLVGSRIGIVLQATFVRSPGAVRD